MKKLYWRPHRVSRLELLLVTLLALGGFAAVETWRVEERLPDYELKIAAADLSRQAMEVIKSERLRRGLNIDPEADPAGSGLIGQLMTVVTSNSGHLPAKQTSVNPNFASLVVHYLKRAGVEEGDTVAVGVSGSFPAINVSVYAALQTVGARPVIIASASSSQWGANLPDLMWLDMERLLMERGVFKFRSTAASRGGIQDRAMGMAKEGRRLLDKAIERAGLEAIAPGSVGASIASRMEVFEKGTKGRRVAAYINVGGGTVSVGSRVGKRLFRPGLNRYAPAGASKVDSVMTRFALNGVPIIHMVRIDDQARRYGLTLHPQEMPPAGEGTFFVRKGYNKLLAGGVVLVVLAVLMAFVRKDWGFRLLRSGGRREARKPPEQMV